MSFPVRPLALVVLMTSLAGCDASVVEGPLSNAPVMVVPAVVDASASRIEMDVTNVSHHSLNYGDCWDRWLDRRTAGGWEQTPYTPNGGVCDLVLHSLRGFGSSATIAVMVGGEIPAGEYRARMLFRHRDREIMGVSNTFRIE